MRTLFIWAALLLCVAHLFFACEQKQVFSPVAAVEQMDSLYAILTPPAQLFSVSSKKTSKVKGKKGSIIYVNPKNLATVDGSPLGKKIEVELIEMTHKSSLLLNNASTTAGNQLLVSGGAYYLNMSSDGQQLQIKEGKSIEVEFPKLTENEMGLFVGQRDSLGQLDWSPTTQKFEQKELVQPVAPSSQKNGQLDAQSELEQILGYIGDSYDSTSREQIKAYEKEEKAYKEALKTYAPIPLTDLGWINCDRFLQENNPKIDLPVALKNDSITHARIYAIFEDINSVMAAYYFSAQKEVASFENIPINRKITLLAIAIKDQQAFMADTTIVTQENQAIALLLQPTATAAIKKKMAEMN